MSLHRTAAAFQVLPLTRELPLWDAAQTQSIEHAASASLAPHSLMRRAGESVARLALAVAPHAQNIWIAAGPGNNGGDGLEAATHLLGFGKNVVVSLVGDAARLPLDASSAFARARAAGVRIDIGSTSPSQDTDLAIDALLGAGANRAPMAALAATIRSINELACAVLAVDLPSGLDALTGNALGDPHDCIVAAHTLSLLTLKPGLFTGAGRDHVGTIWFDALGVDSLALDTPPDSPRAWLSGLTRANALPARLHAQNKGSFGDVIVVGGAPGMTGAALLASRSALAAGAGRVYVELLDAAHRQTSLDPQHPEVMFRPDASRGSPDSVAKATIVCGCGGGVAVRRELPRLMGVATRLVLDADALNAISGDSALASLLRARKGRDLATVLTPHPLEAARLLGCTTRDVQSDRLQAARELADRFKCTVVLKGSGSVIASDECVTRINSTGNASLATAGTGDVLAGWIGGRWAQMPRQSSAQADENSGFAIACRAVAEHGAAAEPQPPGSLRASDLIERLHALPS